MLHQHRLLAQIIGVEKDPLFIINNGDVVINENSVAVKQERWLPAIFCYP